MSEHPMDRARRAKNRAEGSPLCERCKGTGNELYSMYRACQDCGGSGIAKSHPAEEAVQ